MKNQKPSIWAFLAAISFVLTLFSACESQLTGRIEPDFEGSRLTVGGFLSPSAIHFRIGKTVSPYEPHSGLDLLVPDARCFVLDSSGTEVVELFSSDSLNFISKNVALEVGRPFFVRVTGGGLPMIESELVKIPPPTEFDSLRFFPSSFIFNGPTNDVRLFFEDKNAGEDYYFLNFDVKKGTSQQMAVTGIVDESINGACYRRGTFSDACFDGQKAVFKFIFDRTYQFDFNNNEREPADSLVVRFGQVSHSFFERSQNAPSGDELIEGLNELPPTYTNVRGGYGVVFGQNWVDRAFKIEF